MPDPIQRASKNTRHRMGKHQRRGPTFKRPAAYDRDALVVVTPSMLHSGVCEASKPPSNGTKKHQKQSKKRKMDKKGLEDVSRAMKKRKKRQDRTIIANKNESCAAKVPFAETSGSGAPYSVLRVKRDTDVLAGLYWILLSRNTSRPCVVVLPNHDTTSPSHVASIFKHLRLQAVALHHKMTAKQRNEVVQRLEASVSVAMPEHTMVLVTTDHMMGSTASPKADVALVGAVSSAATRLATSKFAHVYHVTGATGLERVKSNTFQPELTVPDLQQLQARLKAAQQIVAIAQCLGKTGAAGQDDEKWARKLAQDADLDEIEQKKTNRALTPNEQKLQALTEKLYIMLTRKLPGNHSERINVVHDKAHETDSQHHREKLRVLGLVTMNATVGTAMTEGRTSAQTRWMDLAEGRAHGGHWEGAVRRGASKDATSLLIRNKVCAARGKTHDSSFLGKWCPNKEPVDEAKWGGAFGKVCGHNEVVMNELRAFYPQEVLNSKVCSKLFPAPGNQGFEGCLEYLRYACMTQRTSMTLWDAEYFIFIASCGRVTWSKKNQLLPLSLASLQCLVPALRGWTTASGGHIPPSAILCAIQLCCQLGCGDKRSIDAKLSLKALKRIMGFAIGGSARLWRQIAKVPLPLEQETVYTSQQ